MSVLPHAPLALSTVLATGDLSQWRFYFELHPGRDPLGAYHSFEKQLIESSYFARLI